MKQGTVVSTFEEAKNLRSDAVAPRMRFAPSPTGSLHVGGARTALYNWLAARKTVDGKFLLRIEDTDVARSTRESEDSMLADLEWLGLDWDEGPRVGGPCKMYRQSERSTIYKEAVDLLVASGHAYPCFCSEEELEEKRVKAKIAGSQVAYDGTWREADPEQVRENLAAGLPHTYRFKVPKGKVVSIDDKVRGRVEWDVQATIGDFILLRSSGVPVYNFCVAVDDALMGVTTVVRAEEHLTNTVRQLLVLEALGFTAPEYAHASLILGSDKSKLSKRHGATSCGQFREKGYLPDAMVNYLALLGWNDGTDKEVYSREELIEAFDLSRVTASPAMFDDAKLRWLNGQHLRAMPLEPLLPLVHEDLTARGLLQQTGSEVSDKIGAFLMAATVAAQPKAELVTDIADMAVAALSYPFTETLGSTESAEQKRLKTILDDDFAGFAVALAASFDNREAPDYCYDAVLAADVDESLVLEWLTRVGSRENRDKKRLLMPARLALTGSTTGIDVSSQLKLLQCALDAGVDASFLVPMHERIRQLKDWAISDSGSFGGDNIYVHPREESAATIIDLKTFSKLRMVYEANRRRAEEDSDMFEILKAAYEQL